MFTSQFSRFSIGGQSDESFSQLPTLSKNQYIISRISKFAALTNKDFFRDTIKARFKKWKIEDNFEYLNESQNELVDQYGRCTFFFIKLGPYKIPLLQPGSFMFDSGIETGTQLVCHHDGCQQNGPIMGMGCACFLAKVLTELTKEYQMRCIENKKNVNNFCPKSYKEATIKVLKQYSKEDATDHGRIVELKRYFNKIGDQENIALDAELEPYYYLKDISVQQNFELETFNIEDLKVDKESIETIKKMRSDNKKYQDIDQYFESESEKKHAMHLDFRNTIKFFLFSKRNIWKDHAQSLMQLDFVFEGLEKTLDQDPMFNQIDDDQDKNTQQTKDQGQKDISYNNLDTQSQSETKSYIIQNQDQDYWTDKIDQDYQLIELNYDIKTNEKLFEYYSQLKRGLDSIMRSALIADSDVFQFKSCGVAECLIEISEIIPDIGCILKAVGMILNHLHEEELKEKLDKLACIYSDFNDLPTILARKITILKRFFIMDLDEHFIKDYFDPKFVAHVNKIKSKQKKTLPQALAIKDTKVLESCCISLIHSNEIIPQKEIHSSVIANKIMNFYKGFQINNQISPKLTKEETPIPFERVIGFIIPDEIFENPIVPKFLKRGLKDRSPEDHKNRVKSYLQKLNQSQLFDLLGAIDPSNQKHIPLLELINEVNRGKEKSFCAIF